jgi:NhaA family Na+:H+ antiporter
VNRFTFEPAWRINSAMRPVTPPPSPRLKLLQRSLAIPGMFRHEAAGGIALMIAAVLALIVANSGLSGTYYQLLHAPLKIGYGALALEKSVLHWVNDGLMAIFFFVVGLEIKKELITGALSNVKTALLPLLGAVGGMIGPALIYVVIVADDTAALRGWAIPAATDIAFAVGVIALLGSRVPPSLKVFILALAIIDDLGAIIIIALFYTEHLSTTAVLVGLAAIGALAVINKLGTRQAWPYLLVGTVLWLCVLKSGVHATLAGVITAFAVPVGSPERPGTAERLEHGLSPWVSFGVLPIFAFANAGVSLEGVGIGKLVEPIPLGIALGLFLGKAIGIFLFAWLAIVSGLGRMPERATVLQLFAVGILGGIGFTMSLFIGMLAFPDPAYAASIRVGVLAGSVASALTGYLLLRFAAGRSGATAP